MGPDDERWRDDSSERWRDDSSGAGTRLCSVKIMRGSVTGIFEVRAALWPNG